ncbi:hypothetical protein QAD02_001309 [Eretmocerus hayati]|uniref:Uncharacterized protein n=1 Tax=Eretmocerus hayati TaxID=131215 RepID=A0ACC2NKH5_9HYME|nr:hypothetical protein QAD02_001309 [Eretmocerus hayati]
MKSIVTIFIAVAISFVSSDDDYEIFTMDQYDTNEIEPVRTAPPYNADEEPMVEVDGIPMVSIRINGKPSGVGVIIAPQFLLTAWTNLRRSPKNNITIVARLGFGDIAPSLTFSIKDVRRHFDFEVRRPANGVSRPINDIAVVRINGNFSVDPGRIMMLPMVEQGYEIPVDHVGEVLGFGPNETPEEGDFIILGQKDCEKRYFNQGGPYNGEICAIGASNPEIPANMCDGDEGSPLIYEQYLVGIATWLFDCDTDGKTKNPAVFTPIGRYRRWIDSVMKEMLSNGGIQTTQ